jgi:hypothetical protein
MAAQSRIMEAVEKEFEAMVNQVQEFRKEDQDCSMSSPSVIRRRLPSVNLSPANFMNMEFKENQRRAIDQEYDRKHLYSDKALINRWFHFLFFELDGNRIREILTNDQTLLSGLMAQQKGRKWRDARISDHTGAWITERLFEKYLPADRPVEEETVYKRIRKWKRNYSPWTPFWKDRSSP